MRKPVFIGKSFSRDLNQCVNRRRLADEPSPERIYHPTVQPLYALGLASAAMTQLTPKCRKMVTLISLQGLSHAGTVTDTGRDLRAVKSDLCRALAQLQEALEGT